MKITHVSPYFPPHYGGVEKHVKEVARLSVEQGDEVTVVTLQDNRQEKLKDERDKVKVLRIPAIGVTNKTKHKFLIWQWIWKNRKIFIDSDIVHIHDVFWWILPIWILIRKKIFITFHGWEGIYSVPVKNKLQRLIWSKLSRGRIHVGKYISEFYWDKADKMMYGGVEPHVFSSPTSLAISPGVFSSSVEDKSEKYFSGEGYKEKLLIVFVGRLEKVNEIENYICMIKKLKELGFKINLLWLGDGVLKKDCEEVGKVLGVVKNQERYIAKANIILANSYLSILKAQAMGKVVVALYSNKLKRSYLENYPGSKYMIVKSSDCEVEVMVSLLKDNKKLSRMQVAAKDFASKMTWEKVLRTYLKLWQMKK